MKQLLQWSGGNVQQALAAYNAGQGNWQAGLGYANTILAKAAS
jgi:soluble lytic murein transglycosylase-like protein